MSHEKVVFQLEVDDDGYPPVGWEGVWATRVDDDQFVLDNIPFFARAATIGDVVHAVREEGELRYQRTVKRSGNSLIRVVYNEGTSAKDVQREFEALGCGAEICGPYPLVAISVPQQVKLDAVQTLLQQGSADDRWDYEEAILRQ